MGGARQDSQLSKSQEQPEPADDRKIDRIPLLRPVQERDADIVMQFCRHSRREIVEIAFHG